MKLLIKCKPLDLALIDDALYIIKFFILYLFQNQLLLFQILLMKSNLVHD